MPKQTARPVTRHTPTPWSTRTSLDGNHIVGDADGLVVAHLYDFAMPAKANGELICRSVNHHEALVAALREAAELVAQDADRHQLTATAYLSAGAYPETATIAQAAATERATWLDNARAVLARVETPEANSKSERAKR